MRVQDEADMMVPHVISQSNGSGSYFSSLPMVHGLNESTVIQIVKDALLKYDADKTGMVDHALESAGGNIISTRCTESYQVGYDAQEPFHLSILTRNGVSYRSTLKFIMFVAGSKYIIQSIQ